MKDVIQISKKIALFLFGVVLVIFGYKANATNNSSNAKEDQDKNKKDKKAEPENVPKVAKQEEKPGVIIYQPGVKKEDNKSKAGQGAKPEAKKAEIKKTEEKKEKTEEKVQKEEPQVTIEKAKTEEASGTE